MISFIRRIYEENSKIVFKFLLILIIVILTVVVSVRQNASNEIDLGAAKETDKVSAEETSEKEYYVDISGEVKKPGVYKVKKKTRLVFLIDKAGGLTGKADLDAINQASYVEDGVKSSFVCKFNSCIIVLLNLSTMLRAQIAALWQFALALLLCQFPLIF